MGKVTTMIVTGAITAAGTLMSMWLGWKLYGETDKTDPALTIEIKKFDAEIRAQHQQRADENAFALAQKRDEWQRQFTAEHYKEGYYFNNYGELSKVRER